MITAGHHLAKQLRGGDVIELIGDVGAGKTTFTKGLAAGLGINEDVQSPTFTISRLYDAKAGLKLAHYDFYRLQGAGIMADELSDAINDQAAVVVVEWGDAVADVLPKDRITIQIQAISEEERQLAVSSPRSLNAWRQELAK